MHQSIGIKLWQSLNQTSSSSPKYSYYSLYLAISIKATRLMSSCCLSVYMSTCLSRRQVWCTLAVCMSQTDVPASTSIQEPLYSGESLDNKKSYCTSTLHHCLYIRFVWNYRVTMVVEICTTCSYKCKIAWSPVSRLASVSPGYRTESTWKMAQSSHSWLSLHLDTGGVHLADTHFRLSLRLIYTWLHSQDTGAQWTKNLHNNYTSPGLTTFLHNTSPNFPKHCLIKLCF